MDCFYWQLITDGGKEYLKSFSFEVEFIASALVVLIATIKQWEFVKGHIATKVVYVTIRVTIATPLGYPRWYKT